jgi:antitoxin (DNA-binding transcriptional repressor) of toxin-antitoxin stability system
MKTMGISKFKTHALKILDRVAKSQDYLVFEKDIVSPLGEEMWDACK